MSDSSLSGRVSRLASINVIAGRVARRVLADLRGTMTEEQAREYLRRHPGSRFTESDLTTPRPPVSDVMKRWRKWNRGNGDRNDGSFWDEKRKEREYNKRVHGVGVNRGPVIPNPPKPKAPVPASPSISSKPPYSGPSKPLPEGFEGEYAFLRKKRNSFIPLSVSEALRLKEMSRQMSEMGITEKDLSSLGSDGNGYSDGLYR